MPLWKRISWPVALFIFALFVSLALDFSAFVSHRQCQQKESLIRDNHEKQALIVKSLADIETATSSTRGYLLSGHMSDPHFFRQLQWTINTDLDHLAKASLENRKYQREFESLIFLISDQMSEVEGAVKSYQDNLGAEALSQRTHKLSATLVGGLQNQIQLANVAKSEMEASVLTIMAVLIHGPLLLVCCFLMLIEIRERVETQNALASLSSQLDVTSLVTAQQAPRADDNKRPLEFL